MQLTELSTEYFLGEAAASVASMVATPLPSRSYLYFTLRKELPKCSSSYKMYNLL